MDSLGIEEVVHRAVAGPSEHAKEFGTVLHTDAWKYVDDDLDIDEERPICGEYRVPVTGNYPILPVYFGKADKSFVGNGNEAKHLTWWPSSSKWETSGYSVGYWSPSAEAWYQTRIDNILSNVSTSQKLYKNSQWKTAIRKHGRINKMLTEMQRVHAAEVDKVMVISP